MAQFWINSDLGRLLDYTWFLCIFVLFFHRKHCKEPYQLLLLARCGRRHGTPGYEAFSHHSCLVGHSFANRPS